MKTLPFLPNPCWGVQGQRLPPPEGPQTVLEVGEQRREAEPTEQRDVHALEQVLVCSFLSSHGFGALTQQAYKRHFTNIILLKFAGFPVRSVRSDIPILQMRNLRLQRGETTCPKSHGRYRYGSTGSHRWRWAAIFTGS